MKSKQKAFLASLIPGLGHIYIGLKSRGSIFLLGFIFLFSISRISSGYSESLGMFYNWHGMNRIIEIFILLSYFATIIDCMLCYDRIFAGKININDEQAQKVENKRLIAMFLSVIPGCGHLLIGKVTKGKNYIMFFLLLYLLSGIAGMEIFKIAILILIILCIFDLYNENITLDYKEQKREDFYADKFRYIFIAAGIILIIYTVMYGITNSLSYFGYADMISNIKYVFNIAMNVLIGLVIAIVLIREGLRYSEKKEKELDEIIEKERQEEIDRQSEENL